MNQKTLLQNALNAINCQKAEACHQLKQAEALQLQKLVEYWTQHVEEHESTYKGLLNWLFTLNGGDQ
ncbi:hypothetical protein [Endozoicomonas acroporae]|uniref:hypothetical protein n=1 Tax=Endozoicomonas acroporae TaxID=1701104 RepID=UPI0013D8CF18|nr:hypothetical protein [Endozoicomonas acroporae]